MLYKVSVQTGKTLRISSISYSITLDEVLVLQEVVVCFVFNNAWILLHLAKIRLPADSNFIDFNMTVCNVIVFI